ncbi:hypothetical protein HK105_203261 [Polyrhizophydium stewartii]|uniref:Uncharacterized protein n=1 Tax=Polyrhizophydium stewartii TaxID=2732419 RepID=A0ABR4NCD6_9FUNG|nr:hypothetical protein HK105_001714 [Polyrhizophydium stewartii]
MDRIERLFWQNVPVRFFDWTGATAALGTPELQDELLARLHLVPSEQEIPAAAHRPKAAAAYVVRFLKALIERLEREGVELSEALYELLAETAVSVAGDGEPECDRCYFLPPAPGTQTPVSGRRLERIVLREHVAEISQGTTGLRTWQASLRLVEHLSAHREVVAGRRIVELGAGVGLLGLACRLLGAASVHMTDVDDAVLARLAGNVAINNLGDSVRTSRLDWEEVGNGDIGTLHLDPFDMIIAADVVFAPELIGPLVRKITCLLRAAAEPPLAECWVASTRRRESTFGMFTDELAAAGLTVESVAASPASWYFYDEGADSVDISRIYFATA